MRFYSFRLLVSIFGIHCNFGHSFQSKAINIISNRQQTDYLEVNTKIDEEPSSIDNKECSRRKFFQQAVSILSIAAISTTMSNMCTGSSNCCAAAATTSTYSTGSNSIDSVDGSTKPNLKNNRRMGGLAAKIRGITGVMVCANNQLELSVTYSDLLIFCEFFSFVIIQLTGRTAT